MEALQPLIQNYINPIFDPSTNWGCKDFTVTIGLGLLVLAVRAVADAIAIPICKSWLSRLGAKQAKDPKALNKAAFAVWNSSWISTTSAVLAAYAWYVTLNNNGGCTPWSAKKCFENWPNMPHEQQQRYFSLAMFAYYLYEMMGVALGVGTKLKTDMVAHHIATMALIVIAYCTNIHAMSVMWQALFDISNPILHAAKALHTSGVKSLEPVKWFCFTLFGLSFLVFRVLAGPYSIIYPSFAYTVGVLPMSYCYTCWTLIIAIYALQLVWFYKIVQLATNPAAAEKED